ncbi:helix-turn-helix domain-containing protein [Actinomycetota bacterium Odt1-20B]
MRKHRERQPELMSLRDLDAAGGLASGQAAKVESGQVRPRPQTVVKIAQGLAVLPRDLFTVPKDEVTLVHLRVWAGFSLEQAAAELAWPSYSLGRMEQGHTPWQPHGSRRSWRKLADVYRVEEYEARAAWRNSSRIRLAAKAVS